MIKYPAIIKYDKSDKGFNVEFPDLPGCFTCADTEEEAIVFAKEALTGYLESIDSRKLKIPRPSTLKGKNVHYISPEKKAGFAIWLKTKREEQGFSQKQIATKLGITYQTYQRFENPSKANPTLTTITKLENLYNESLLNV